MFKIKIHDEKQVLLSEGRLYGDVFIPSFFERTILRHILLNSLKADGFRPAPLLLLQGKKGEGKTFMTETILKGNGIRYKIISSSILAGKGENDAVNNLMLYYNNCQMCVEKGVYSALVIDDFHLSIAISKTNASYTTNADGLLSALMNIADKKSDLKAPIILIGNNFTNAYAPLTRFGRMNICTWSPSKNDKTEILKRMIMQYPHDPDSITYDELNRFIECYKDQYIGFFEQVIENVIFQDFRNVTDRFAARGGKVSYQELIKDIHDNLNKKRITVAKMHEEAQELLSNTIEEFDE